MVYRLFYVSSAASLLSESDLAQLLMEARRSNADAGVSGLMIYHDGGFLQVLEGERATIERLFATIRADKRHRNVIVLWQGSADTRLFDGWTMGVARPAHLSSEPALQAHAVDLDSLLRPDAAWNADPVFATLLRQFLRSYRDLGG